MPKREVIHAIVDNYATHKHPKVRAWLARHPRWTFHFTPTSASWLKPVDAGEGQTARGLAAEHIQLVDRRLVLR